MQLRNKRYCQCRRSNSCEGFLGLYWMYSTIRAFGLAYALFSLPKKNNLWLN